jgi:DNA polymerase/3'-5' exonuclease PolX
MEAANGVTISDIEEAIKRIRQEKAEVIQDLYDRGKIDGLEWAKNAHYLDLKAAVEWDPNSGPPENEKLWEEIMKMIEEYPELEFDNGYGYMTDTTSNWAIGWAEGVQAFWDEVKAKI